MTEYWHDTKGHEYRVLSTTFSAGSLTVEVQAALTVADPDLCTKTRPHGPEHTFNLPVQDYLDGEHTNRRGTAFRRGRHPAVLATEPQPDVVVMWGARRLWGARDVITFRREDDARSLVAEDPDNYELVRRATVTAQTEWEAP